MCLWRTKSVWYVELIRHVFRTNITHFVKNAHGVKIYAAYMRILHIDTIPPNLLHFALDSNSSHAWPERNFIQVTVKFHKFYGTIVRIFKCKSSNVSMSHVARKRLF